MPRPSCPRCGAPQCSRRKREGLLQILIYPRFGLFPWRCSACRKVFLLKERGKSRRRHTLDERPGAPVLEGKPPSLPDPGEEQRAGNS
jgi:hypothetical protein